MDGSDWTASGRQTNASETYLKLVEAVALLLIENGGSCLDRGWVRSQARLIVSQLAHVHGMAPVKRG